jgi:hypothetical protein
MRIILREYLGMLRESGEFDALLPDLLREMQFVPLSAPQQGVRQAGVDLAAVGNDADGRRSLWLFVLKRGDLGRKDWDTLPQSIHPSLNEIQDVYLRNNVAPEHKDLPVRIVVATTGDFKQEIQQNLVGYADRIKRDGLDLETWNGDRVAELMEQYLLTENVLPGSARSQLRRALALVGEPEYDLQHYHELLRELLDWAPANPAGVAKQGRARVRSLATVHLALGILCRWASADGNLRNALLAAERTVLWAWDAVRKAEAAEDKDLFDAYVRLVHTYLEVSIEYFNKVQGHLFVKNAIARYYRESPLLTERVFEEVGNVGSIGLSHFLFGVVTKDQQLLDGANALAESLNALVETHPISGSPCYDNQCIDISLALLLLCFTERREVAKSWLNQLASRLIYAYRIGKWFPIATDSFDDLVAFEIERNEVDLQKLKEMSWMIPTVAQWCAVLGVDEAYAGIVGLKSEVMKGTCFQLWYPDMHTDNIRYDRPAFLESGMSDAPLDLPATAEEMREQIKRTRSDSPVADQVVTSAAKAGLPFVEFIACRHFRIPVDPAYWQRILTEATPDIPSPPGSAS